FMNLKAQYLLRGFIAVLTLGTTGSCLYGKDVLAPSEFTAARSFIDEGIRSGRAPSVAVAVVKDDRVVWAEGFGLADVEARRAANSDSIYLMASVSKPITATGLMTLVDRGLMDLDKPANSYLPHSQIRAYRGSVDDITIRRLANHTSGLPTHWDFFYN